MGRSCRKQLDPQGDHLASCMRTGRVRRRAKPLERMWARIFREAGGRVLENVFMRDMGIPGVEQYDGRRLEVVVTGLPIFNGVPLAVDATLVSPLHADGTPWPRADERSGVAIRRAEKDKATTYPELVQSPIALLTTLACEVGGRWSQKCQETISQLSHARARSVAQHLRAAYRRALEARWWAMLSCTQQNALAATLHDDSVLLLDAHDAEGPVAADAILDLGRGY